VGPGYEIAYVRLYEDVTSGRCSRRSSPRCRATRTSSIFSPTTSTCSSRTFASCLRYRSEGPLPDEGDRPLRGDRSPGLYNYSRNPLAHSLGLGGPTGVQVFIAEKALSQKQIHELEDSPTLPHWSREALFDAGVQPGPSYRIGISGLYWGRGGLAGRGGRLPGPVPATVAPRKSEAGTGPAFAKAP